MTRTRAGLCAGLAAVCITTAVIMTGEATGWLPRAMDLRGMAPFVDRLNRPGLALAAGIIVHLFAGGAIGAVFGKWVSEPSALKGIMFLLPIWLILMVVGYPLTGSGLFGLQQGWTPMAGTLVLHILFGSVLGLWTRRLRRPAAT